ncbi:TIM barrel protein [Alphaproteobacteria bacterium]|nr:TIM barrel protein [Alphaproteobacteria bacterium]
MKIGIMQGRLLPKIKNQFQAFPGKNWQDEFIIASNISLDLIEFIFDIDDDIPNPLSTEQGIDNIKDIVHKSGVEVRSICADYFMKFPFYNNENHNVIDVMNKLIVSSNKINVKEIVLPCIDSSSLNSDFKKSELIRNINSVKQLLEKHKVTLCIETDLSPDKNNDIISDIGSSFIKLNYDTGNSASLGYEAKDELLLNSNIISSYHIKDRKFNSHSVLLGEGDYDFDIFIDMVSKKIICPEYIIFQVFRDNEGIEIFKKQLNWFNKKIINLHSD